MTGINSPWIRPGCQASDPSDSGYDIHDLYDLGDFDVKVSIDTKWGTKEGLMDLVNKGQRGRNRDILGCGPQS